jgi:hypothetical protein
VNVVLDGEPGMPVRVNEKSCKSAKFVVKEEGARSELSKTAVPVPVVVVVPPPSEKSICMRDACADVTVNPSVRTTRAMKRAKRIGRVRVAP